MRVAICMELDDLRDALTAIRRAYAGEPPVVVAELLDRLTEVLDREVARLDTGENGVG